MVDHVTRAWLDLEAALNREPTESDLGTYRLHKKAFRAGLKREDLVAKNVTGGGCFWQIHHRRHGGVLWQAYGLDALHGKGHFIGWGFLSKDEAEKAITEVLQ